MEIVQEIGQTMNGDGVANLCAQAMELCKVFHTYQAKEIAMKEREINATLKQMETWRSRRENAKGTIINHASLTPTKEYTIEMKRLEVEWKATHAAENQACLDRLSTLIPENITSMSVEQLLETTKAAGVLYTRDLANYLKQNK